LVDRIQRYADLAVRIGANVGQGQLVEVRANIEHAELARATVAAAYRAGARYVQLNYSDDVARRTMIDLAPDEALSWSSPALLSFLEALEAEQGASINIVGDPDPNLFVGADQARLGRARPSDYRRLWLRLVAQRRVNWTIVACPTPGWARQIFGEPDLERLWQLVERCVRLDESDPVAAWEAHLERLGDMASLLNERAFDSLRYRGPGTDLMVGLMPSSRWHGGPSETSFGRRHVANMPTEEVFTAPDRRRAEGRIRSTRPLALNGSLVEGLELEFRQGRVVEVKADRGAGIVEAQLGIDPGAASLGEVALVDSRSRVGATGVTYFNTLYDENATSHIAFGAGFAFTVADPDEREEGVSRSAVHTDFMVGGPEVEIDGLTGTGQVIPILRDDVFQLS